MQKVAKELMSMGRVEQGDGKITDLNCYEQLFGLLKYREATLLSEVPFYSIDLLSH